MVEMKGMQWVGQSDELDQALKEQRGIASKAERLINKNRKRD